MSVGNALRGVPWPCVAFGTKVALVSRQWGQNTGKMPVPPK